ncbi:ComF family protein [uncultured Parabacteroides sp.]|uniref:ComF family protein n=1 Tax=uncultured Parabacteroides sp. TaxID=512312 RepID=UPI002602170B|nr:ComF family protein [uncultured Parabacteroides sp.]
MTTRMILNDLLNLFYSRLCLLCQTPLVKGEEHICLHCSNHLPYTHFTDMETNPVCRLFEGKVSFVAATALLHFTKGGSGQKLIHSLKYHGNKKLGYELGRMAATAYRETGLFDTVDLLLPVPLHPKRMRQRGYNQSEWIARGIQSVIGIPVDTSSLSRIKKTESQTRKQIFERSENVEDIFRLSNADALKNKHVLLLDDVITTGSTISACAKAMKAISGIRISILGIAVA